MGMKSGRYRKKSYKNEDGRYAFPQTNHGIRTKDHKCKENNWYEAKHIRYQRGNKRLSRNSANTYAKNDWKQNFEVDKML
jgi:hypothetical protein